MTDDQQLTATDGTSFAIQSEQVRGEPRVYWIMRRDVGASSYQEDFGYQESYDKRTALRRLRKAVAEWNARPREEE